MKIEYGQDTIGDDLAGDIITPAITRQHNREVQVDTLAGAGAPFVYPRGNVRNTVSFVIDRQHANNEAAVIHILTYPDSLPNQAALRISQDYEAFQMADACLVSAEIVALIGRSTQIRYTFTGGPLTSAV